MHANEGWRPKAVSKDEGVLATVSHAAPRSRSA